MKFHGACFSFDGPKGCRGRAESPVQASGCDNFAMKISLVGGLTRRLRRGAGLASLWGAHTFLSMAKEKCAKESQRHGTTGKRLLLPILTAGLAMSRAMELDSYHLRFERARAHLFPPSKWRAFFPPLPIATLLLRSWRWADLNSVSWEVTAWLGWFRSAEKRICFFFCVGEEPIQTAPLRLFR